VPAGYACRSIWLRPQCSSEAELHQVIQVVDQGKKYVTPEMTQCLLAQPAWNPQQDITLRHREILLRIMEGKTSKEIAYSTSVCRPLKSHRAELMRRLGVRNTAQLVSFAIRCGLVVGAYTATKRVA